MATDPHVESVVKELLRLARQDAGVRHRTNLDGAACSAAAALLQRKRDANRCKCGMSLAVSHYCSSLDHCYRSRLIQLEAGDDD